MTNPLVSVIMTVRNCDRFVEESINSIINQYFKDFELIVYDDKSTDGTLKIVEETLKGSGIRYVIKTPFVGERVGCGQGRNKAIQEAMGKYIAIQDADDISFPDRLQKEVDFLEKNEDVFCVSSWADVIDEKGDMIDCFVYPPLNHNDIKVEILRKNNNPMIDPSSMFRKNIFNELGGYDKKWKLVPDFNLWRRAVIKGYKFGNIGEQLVKYRKHPDSVTTKHNAEAIKEHYCMCKEVV